MQLSLSYPNAGLVDYISQTSADYKIVWFGQYDTLGRHNLLAVDTLLLVYYWLRVVLYC